MRALSLFSGIGGIDLACEWAGIQTVAFCEREPFPQQVLRKHWPGVPIYDDVLNLTKERLDADGIGAIDLVSAGFPCQPFSNAGKREGSDDERYLWPEVVRVLEDFRPSWFIGENVVGLLSMAEPVGQPELESRILQLGSEEDFYEAVFTQKEIMLFGNICQDLEGIGYQVIPFVVPAAAVKASDERFRVFIAGFLGDSERIGCSREPRRWAESQPKDGYFGVEGEPMADSSRERFGGTRRDRSNKPEKRFAWGSEYRTIWANESGMGGSSDELSAWLDGCGVNPLDKLEQLIAEYPQPALMGQAQHDWEPPRVATGVPNRVSRLKALGNAVDPLQVLPILAAIKMIDDHIAAHKGIGRR